MAQNFQNLLQSMSNSAASNVSAPVDGLAWLLRKAGVPVPKNALLGSDWMAERGLTKPVPQGAASLAGETLGLLAPMAAAAKAPQIAQGLLAVERNALAPNVVNRGGAAKQRGIFMGDMSATWNKEAAAKAQAMEKAGADPRAIWQETGTFKGADGKWRQEIDDSAAKMSGVDPTQATAEAYKTGGIEAMKEMRERLKDYVQPYRRTDYTNELGNVFEHGQLDKAYGDFMPYMGYRGMDSPKIGEGFYSPKQNLIGLSPANQETAKSAMLHELQHAVQERQGFAKGGAPELMRDEAMKMLRRDVGSGAIPSTEQAMSMLPMYEHNAYQRLAGEVEARAVQKRMNLTAEQRRALFPLDSYDVPVNSLLLR